MIFQKNFDVSLVGNMNSFYINFLAFYFKSHVLKVVASIYLRLEKSYVAANTDNYFKILKKLKKRQKGGFQQFFESFSLMKHFIE